MTGGILGRNLPPNWLKQLARLFAWWHLQGEKISRQCWALAGGDRASWVNVEQVFPSRARVASELPEMAGKTHKAQSRAESEELRELFRIAEHGVPDRLASRRGRIITLLQSQDQRIALETERLMLEQQFGKARAQVEVSGDQRVTYTVEAPQSETAEEWVKRHAALRAEADRAENDEGEKAN